MEKGRGRWLLETGAAGKSRKKREREIVRERGGRGRKGRRREGGRGRGREGDSRTEREKGGRLAGPL